MDGHINQAAADGAPTRFLRIEFTGSGSEYFRIWIVNLLLSIVTLGLYLPFAKARRLGYFYSNTVIDGQALAFHGNPWKMLRGFLLLAVLMLAYGAAGHFSPLGGLFAFCVLCIVWPALWRASLQFRLSNTSWRGLRFAFRGDLAGAYIAVLPVYLPALVMVATQTLLAQNMEEGSKLSDTQAWLIFAPLGLIYLLMPWALALVKRYQHGAYAYADQQTRLGVSTWRFYVLCLKGFAVVLLLVLLFGGIGLAVAVLIGAGVKPSPLLLGIGVGVSYLLLFALIAPYYTARLQNMIWVGTTSPALRFDSQLHFWPLAGLTLKNWLLTLLTLGLYRPFAAVNTTQLRLAAMGISVDGDLDSWTARYIAGQQDASGDAAGDFFGIDMGL